MQNRFNGSEAHDFPKGNGKIQAFVLDPPCIMMLARLSNIAGKNRSETLRDLIRQSAKENGCFIDSYRKQEDKTIGLFD